MKEFLHIIKSWLCFNRNWTLKYTAEYEQKWTYVKTGKPAPSDIITFFLYEDQYGHRKVEHESFGESKLQKTHLEYEAVMKLWRETGILPKHAKSVLMEKLKT